MFIEKRMMSREYTKNYGTEGECFISKNFVLGFTLVWIFDKPKIEIIYLKNPRMDKVYINLIDNNLTPST